VLSGAGVADGDVVSLAGILGGVAMVGWGIAWAARLTRPLVARSRRMRSRWADLIRGKYAMALCDRYQRDGTLEDLEHAVELTSEGSAPILLAARTLAMFLLADATNDPEMLNQAVTAAEEAAKLEITGEDQVTALMRVAQMRLMRFQRTGDPADLERMQEAGKQLQQLPVEHRGDVLLILSAVAEMSGRTGRPDAVEEAVKYAKAALVLNKGGENGAVSALRLAGCLRLRYKATGEPGDLDRAVDLLEDAQRDVPRIERAPLLALLADAYVLRYHRTRATDDLDAAAKAATGAVEAASSGTADLLGARTVLAQVTGERLDADLSTDRRADAERQIHDLRDILSQASSTWPFRASALRMLGLAWADQWRDTTARTDLDEALAALERAIEASTPATVEHIEIVRAAAAIRREAFSADRRPEDLERAVQASQEALETLDERLVELPVSYLVGQQRSFASVYETAVSSYVDWAKIRPDDAADSIARAMLACERSKSRVLAQQLGAQGVPAPPGIDPDLLASEKTLVTKLAALNAGEYAGLGRDAGASDPRELTRRRREIVEELRRTWSALTETEEGAGYVALRGDANLDWEHLQSVARDLGERTALMSLFLAEDRTYGFILRAPWDVPELVSADELDDAAWNAVGRRLFRELHRPDPSGRLDMTWHQPLKPFLRAAGTHLAGIDRVIVAPHRLAHVIPWTVAADAAGWSPTTAIATVPSVTTLTRIRHRDTHHTGDVLVVGDPREDLPGAEQEARTVAELHGVPALIGPQATKAKVQALLQQARLAHLSTHAFFAPGSPLDSGVILADGVLSAREVLTAGSVPPLVILSACESGLSDGLGGDEIAGLAQAFLFAGARSLVVSLWRVNDPATSILMCMLHAHLDKGADLAAALRASAEHVRASERWSHPHYWGAFVVQGDPVLDLS